MAGTAMPRLASECLGGVRLSSLPLDLETDLDRHLELLDLRVRNPTALRHHLKPVQMTDCVCRLYDCRLYRFGKADRGCAHDFRNLISSTHNSNPPCSRYPTSCSPAVTKNLAILRIFAPSW